MPNPTPADAKITVFITGVNAQPMEFGLYCDFGASPGITNFETWLDGGAGGQFLDILSSTYTLRGYRFENASGFSDVTFNDAGQNVMSADAAPSTAILVQTKTNTYAVPGLKRSSSRFYVPGCLSDANVNSLGQIDGAHRAVLQTTFDGMFAALVADDLIPVVRHVEDNSTTVVTEFFVQGYIGTQRRRIHRTPV